MKALRSIRFLALLSTLALLFPAAFVAGLTQAAPAVRHGGGVGQGLALRAALRGLAMPAAHPQPFSALGVPSNVRRTDRGRFVPDYPSRPSQMRSNAIRKANAAAATTAQVDEAVQTFDVFNPTPGFTPTQGPSLTPRNLEPVWTADETMLVFSSNRTVSGTAGARYHIWAIPVNGGTPVQLTTSAGLAGGGEFFPALSAGNNAQLAFTSDAQTPGTQNLFSIPFAATTVDVATQPSPTIRTDAFALAQGGTGFSQVFRPTFSATRSDEIIFSALSTAGQYVGLDHIFFLYTGTGGSDPNNPSLPAKLTDGPGDDTDPAYSADGQLIAFASTATSLSPVTQQSGSRFDQTALLTAGPDAGGKRSLFLIGGGARTGFGIPTNGGKPATLAGTDNFGPAWSSLNANQYTNPAPGAEYLAFSRGAGPTAPHDIYYLQVLRNIQSGGETGKSNEAATTPVPALTPIYQVNAGGPAVTDQRFPAANYTADQASPGAAGNYYFIGGTADVPNPPPATNTFNDSQAPPAIYNTDRSGTFSYTFGGLTPTAPYIVRLHLSDPKNALPGTRVFNVSINGNQTQTVDIVQLAQSAPSRLQGLVTDSGTGQPLAGATITVTDQTGAPVQTMPSPLVTTANNAATNYDTTVPQGTYTVTVTAPGFPSESQVVNIQSGSTARADFALNSATGTLKVTAVDTNKAFATGAAVSVTDQATGVSVVTPPGVIGMDGTFTATVPVGSYDVTVTPPSGANLGVMTQQTTVTAANTATSPDVVPFVLQTGATVGSIGGLITDSVSKLPLAGVTVRLLKAGATATAGPVTVAILTTSATSSASPAAPDGDGALVNYIGRVTVGTYTAQFSAPGYATQTQAVTIGPTVATATVPSTNFVRANKALVSSAPVLGQNTAVTLDIDATVSTFTRTDDKGVTTVPKGVIRVSFAPAPNGGDPPVVQGIEVLASNDPATSSGLGGDSGTSASLAPILSATGGDGLVTLSYTVASGIPSFYNIYRSTSGSGTEGTTPYKTNVADTTFVDKNVTDGTEYFYQVTAVFQETMSTEGPQADGTTNAAIKLNTDDNAGQTSTGGNLYDDIYPTWSPFRSIFSIAYSSNRSVTYNDPATGLPSETAISLPHGANVGGGGAVGPTYEGIFESQVLNLDPPTLVPYNGNEVLHVTDANGVTSRAGLTPGRPVTVTVRLSSREAGVDPDNVYLQAKDPDSKYQDAQRQEHKVFAKDQQFAFQTNNPNLNTPDSGSSTQLLNGGGYSGFNFLGGFRYSQRGSVGGLETDTGGNGGNPGDTIGVGTVPVANQNTTNPVTTGDDGKPFLDANGNPKPAPGFDPSVFIPWGPEYECQVVNPQFASNPIGSAGDTNPNDYTNPYYLAGVDDQRAFSGFPAPGVFRGLVEIFSFTQDAKGVFHTSETPVGGATITIADARTGQPVQTTPSPLVTTASPTLASDGVTPLYNFTTPLPPGTYTITITKPGIITRIQTVTVSERQTTTETFNVDPSFAGGPTVQDFSFFFGGRFSNTTSNGHLPRPTANFTGTTTTMTFNNTTGMEVTKKTTTFHPAEWLKMTRLPDAQQDGQGGALYSVTWTPPTSGSDFYLDVIAYDKAQFPNLANGTSSFSGERGNFRIYDNVWGFSTQRDIGNNDILVVSDYALGQKFAATTFGGQNSLVNLVPKFYGAESYLTDIDTSILPNAVDLQANIAGRKYPIEETLPMISLTGQFGNGGSTQTSSYGNTNVLNGLGVGSYDDVNIDDLGRIDGVPAVASQQYSIWRVLARGPVPASVYQQYEPTFTTQPAVNDTTVTPTIAFPAGKVPNANRCIIWLSPFAGDLLVGPGTITDPATQANLRAFVTAGGRLFMTGQDVGSALTQGGTTSNAAGGFLVDVLGASLVTPNKGTFNAQGGGDIANNRISNVAFYDGENRMNFYELGADDIFHFTAPYQRPLLLGNDIGENFFTDQIGVDGARFPVWRTDGSLDQLGPYAQPFAPGGRGSSGGSATDRNNSVLGQIDTLKPAGTNVHADLTLAPYTNTIPGVPIGDPNAASSPGGIGLVYYDNPVTAAGGTGTKVVYSAFGLEALSTDYYGRYVTAFNINTKFYLPRNQRQDVLHNIVCYLRTGTVQGTVKATAGNTSPGAGIPGATVYLISNTPGLKIPGRGTFSGVTDSSGAFRIQGVEPGTYTLAAYAQGFTRAVSNATQTFTVEGDASQSASVTLTATTPGSLSGTVTDPQGNLIAGASVTFVPANGGQTLTATTDANGKYTVSNAPAGTYTGSAADPPGFGPSKTQTVTVTSGGSTTANFVLLPGAGSITGRVLAQATNAPISGATVYVTTGSPTAVVATAVTDATGTYTITIGAGSYTLTAAAVGFSNSPPTPAVVSGGAPTVEPDILLGPATAGSLSGLVTTAGSTTPLAGISLTITNTGTGIAVSPAPITTGASTTAPAPDGGQINYGPVSLLPGTYTVTATKSGVTTAPQTVTVTANTFTRVDFSGVNGLASVHTFGAGLNFLSLPYDYSGQTFDSLFGTLNTSPVGTAPNGNRSHVAVWDPTVGMYAVEPNAPADAPHLGVGEWIYFKSAVGINLTGTTPTGSVGVALHPSWNQLGVPTLKGVLVSALKFDMGGGNVLSFADATGSANHVVSPTLYRYDGTAYQAVSATDTLQPWQAYWIKVFADTTVRVPTGQ